MQVAPQSYYSSEDDVREGLTFYPDYHHHIIAGTINCDHLWLYVSSTKHLRPPLYDRSNYSSEDDVRGGPKLRQESKEGSLRWLRAADSQLWPRPRTIS